MGLFSIADEGRAEEMCREAGLVPGGRHRVNFVMEGPDLDFEVRAALATGPAYLAVKDRGRDDVIDALKAALADFETPGLGVRIPVTIEYLVAQKVAS